MADSIYFNSFFNSSFIFIFICFIFYFELKTRVWHDIIYYYYKLSYSAIYQSSRQWTLNIFFSYFSFSFILFLFLET